MALKKTAWMGMIWPAQLGLILGSGGRADPQSVVRFGYFLGVAFQIEDDLRNLSVDPGYGKEMNGDLFEAKRTLMLIHVRQACSDARAVSGSTPSSAQPRRTRSPDDVLWLAGLMQRLGSIDHAPGGRAPPWPAPPRTSSTLAYGGLAAVGGPELHRRPGPLDLRAAMSGRALLYGATGYTGRLVARRLAAAGVEVVLAGRDAEGVRRGRRAARPRLDAPSTLARRRRGGARAGRHRRRPARGRTVRRHRRADARRLPAGRRALPGPRRRMAGVRGRRSRATRRRARRGIMLMPGVGPDDRGHRLPAGAGQAGAAGRGEAAPGRLAAAGDHPRNGGQRREPAQPGAW